MTLEGESVFLDDLTVLKFVYFVLFVFLQCRFQFRFSHPNCSIFNIKTYYIFPFYFSLIPLYI